ncbi:MAG: hypothetical protein EHM65_11400, partial [Acidobacteriales bacterium]
MRGIRGSRYRWPCRRSHRSLSECLRTVRMPLYEYQCSKCDGFVEALQKLSDPPLTVHV